MELEKKISNEVKIGDKTHPVDSFIEFGNEPKALAIVKGDLYYKGHGEVYHLVKKNYEPHSPHKK